MDFSRQTLSGSWNICLHWKLWCVASFRPLVSVNFFNVESMKTYIMNSLKREKTPWTNFRKKHELNKRENAEYYLDESRRKELENKAYPSKFMAATMFFGSRLVDWMFGSLEVATTFLLFRWLVPFPFTVFPEVFLVGFPRIEWAIFVSGARRVRSSCFIGRRPDPVDSRFDEVW